MHCVDDIEHSGRQVAFGSSAATNNSGCRAVGSEAFAPRAVQRCRCRYAWRSPRAERGMDHRRPQGANVMGKPPEANRAGSRAPWMVARASREHRALGRRGGRVCWTAAHRARLQTELGPAAGDAVWAAMIEL